MFYQASSIKQKNLSMLGLNPSEELHIPKLYLIISLLQNITLQFSAHQTRVVENKYLI